MIVRAGIVQLAFVSVLIVFTTTIFQVHYQFYTQRKLAVTINKFDINTVLDKIKSFFEFFNFPPTVERHTEKHSRYTKFLKTEKKFSEKLAKRLIHRLLGSNGEINPNIELYSMEVFYSMRNSIVKYNDNYYKLLFNDVPLAWSLGNREQYGFLKLNESNPLDAFIILQNPWIDLSEVNLNIYNKSNVVDSIPTFAIDETHPNNSKQLHLRTRKEMLIILSTSNQLKMTMLTLDYLKSIFPEADLIIMDDYSVDGTIDYMIKRGYAVFTKPMVKGLTDSWNKGYEFANAMGYKYMMLTNNDVLLSPYTIKIIRDDLKKYPLVGPLTTPKGAGHNPTQSIITAFNLSLPMSDYVYDFHNMEAIQQGLFNVRRNKSSRIPHIVNSTYKQYIRFNGFCFAINLNIIKPAAISYPTLLFNASNLMVGQEDGLVEKMVQNKLYPRIANTAFAYHFKSVTVRAAGGISAGLNKSRPDPRENLDTYKVTTDLNYIPTVLLSKFPDTSKSALHESTQYNKTQYTTTYPNLYYNYPKLSTITELNVFPSMADPVLSHGSVYSSPERDEYEIAIANENKNKIIIALAISDRVKNPAAGDIFTAEELAEALEQNYNVEIRYLYKGVSWYNSRFLFDLDILITFLDDYDIGKALVISRNEFGRKGHLRSSVKMNLITIAWMRNWFQRWLYRPWIGNYDLLMTSSETSKRFFLDVQAKIGLQVKCVMACPYFLHPIYSATNDPSNLLTMPKGDFNFINNRRSIVPVEAYPIATDHHTFQPELVTNVSASIFLQVLEAQFGPGYRPDYAFTGSYFKAYRRIMEFDPGTIPKWKGVIVGENWNTANVSDGWKNISIGRLPYEAIPDVYKSGLKIVIDDSNHVTRPWGSVNSRVFDALSAGLLVITNGVVGINGIFTPELMQPLVPPTYESGEELAKLIDYYLSNDDKRNELITKMRGIILANHTYEARSGQLVQIVKNHFNITITEKLKINTSAIVALSPMKPHVISKAFKNKKIAKKYTSLCVGIRMIEMQGPLLELLLKSLVEQYLSSPFTEFISFRIYMIDTENTSPQFNSFLRHITNQINSMAYRRIVFLAKQDGVPEREYQNPFYGYDSTEFLMSQMLHEYQTSMVSRHHVYKQSVCDWILVTNGDNMYNNAWFDAITPYLGRRDLDILGWDFVSHHPRDGVTNTVISIELKRRYVDLGSVLIRSNLFLKSKAEFLPESLFTPDLFARDFLLLERMMNVTNENRTMLIHKCLLFHQ
eukprot:gene8893-11996_t